MVSISADWHTRWVGNATYSRMKPIPVHLLGHSRDWGVTDSSHPTQIVIFVVPASGKLIYMLVEAVNAATTPATPPLKVRQTLLDVAFPAY